jgi:CRP-like cAMP-binding protein/glyoxylase-like metal-dependent hydrolase (beta-lactamase superfamily II)
MIIHLPNNSHVVPTPAGNVLVNCPPETLKVLLAEGLEPPQIILLPPDMPPGEALGCAGFVRQGINYASVEFLLYANFFGQQRTARIITPTAVQATRLNLILEETFTGPLLPSQYGDAPWLQAECAAVGYYPPLGRAPTHADLGSVTSLEEGGGDLGAGVSVQLQGDEFVFWHHGREIARLSTATPAPPTAPSLAPPRPLLRHELTLQFIGGSDGFDPAGITTCFLAYLNPTPLPAEGQIHPTLFDTAAYLRLRLGNLGLSPRQISEVFISHLHEDHLAGLPELLLMGDTRIRLLTADIIYESLLRVLSGMFAMPEADVAALFDYIPLNPGVPVVLEGRKFESLYAVHTIPTLAVRVNGLYYSGDMRYDEVWFADLVSAGILSPSRRDSLVHFAEGATVLVQDAGGGAVHTTITPELLAALAAKGQKVILAHTSKEGLLGDEAAVWHGRVSVAGSGYVAALGAEIQPSFAYLPELETIEANPLLARLPHAQLRQLAQQVGKILYADGELIMADGELVDGNVYLVHAGLVQIWEGDVLRMEIGRGSSLGERGALAGNWRLNNVLAHGRVELLCLTPELFAPIARQLHLHQAFDRAEWLWQQPIFSRLLWSTVLDMALDFAPRQLSTGEILFEQGEYPSESYLLVQGGVQIVGVGGEWLGDITEPGSFFGARSAIYKTVRNATAVALTPSEVWVLPLNALQRLQMVYPHLLLHLRAIEGGRSAGE